MGIFRIFVVRGTGGAVARCPGSADSWSERLLCCCCFIGVVSHRWWGDAVVAGAGARRDEIAPSRSTIRFEHRPSGVPDQDVQPDPITEPLAQFLCRQVGPATLGQASSSHKPTHSCGFWLLMNFIGRSNFSLRLPSLENHCWKNQSRILNNCQPRSRS